MKNETKWKESGLNFITLETLIWLANQYANNHDLKVENGIIYERGGKDVAQ